MTFTRMARTRAGFAVAAAAAMLATGITTTPAATASTNGWIFNGTLNAPARDSDGRVDISGRLVVPACPDQARGCWLAVHRLEDGPNAGWQEIQARGTRLVFRTAGVFDVSGWAFLSEGTWQIGVVAGIATNGRPQGSVIATGLSSEVSVPGESSSRMVTEATSSSIVQGETLTVSVAEEVTWTDGIVTFRQVSGTRVLAWRPVGAALWDRVDSGQDSFTVSPQGPGEFRVVVNGQAAEPVFVNVIRPTRAHRISEPVTSSNSAIANSALTMSAGMETQYDDNVWRPSPIGTRFELQFLADGSTAWARLLSSAVREPGVATIRFSMLTTGRYRLAASDATSLSVYIQEIVPVGIPAIEPVALPATVALGDPIDVSTTVDIEYSDGNVREVPNGTGFEVQFARPPAKSPDGVIEARSELRWKTAAKGKIRNGVLTTKIRPRVSGYWRLKVGAAVTPATMITIRRR